DAPLAHERRRREPRSASRGPAQLRRLRRRRARPPSPCARRNPGGRGRSRLAPDRPRARQLRATGRAGSAMARGPDRALLVAADLLAPRPIADMSNEILHITTRSAWEAARTAGRYEPPSFAQDGFIHFSDPHQVGAVAQALYAGVDDLVLLHVST